APASASLTLPSVCTILSGMKELAKELDRWHGRGERVALATVVSARRSAPRPIGSKLAVSESGELAGSVSGGCVDGDVFGEAREGGRAGWGAGGAAAGGGGGGGGSGAPPGGGRAPGGGGRWAGGGGGRGGAGGGRGGGGGGGWWWAARGSPSEGPTGSGRNID